MVYRRCPSKDHKGERFYEKKLGACPQCGSEARFNPALRTAQLNNQLYGQVEQQQSEASFARRARSEREPH